MRTAGVREARQDMTSLLEDVRKGREVLITDRGRPVARLCPVAARQPFPDLAQVRAMTRDRQVRLAEAVLDDRADRV
ncbi:type II toxin-antitoxin system Phd/YefM family antitoxin [Luteitalea sp.]|jgi:prevent-host-death family protein|uniref:type II toxin-antitoxin system Phd/YefM family antitoxin n=1 Tax=Luteitalea sp. TaxID=2004800 RepID=UPI0037CA6EB1